METLLGKNNPRYLKLMEISKLRDPELRAAAIERGYPIEKLRIGSLAELTNWLLDHYEDGVDKSKLAAASKIAPVSKKGIKLPMIAKPEKIEPKVKKPKGEKRVKNTELGIYKGTKKEYTYFLAKDLFTKFGKEDTAKELIANYSAQVFAKIEKKFGTVSEKSVKIWMKRCLDGLYT